MHEIIKSIKEHIISTLQSNYQVEVPDFILSQCRDVSHGDLTCNVSFLLAKHLQKSPKLLAEDLAKIICHSDIDSVTAVSGYLNFKIQLSLKKAMLSSLLTNGPKSFISDHGKNQKCLLEYVSANPTGPLHVGHGRQAVVAHVLVNIMKLCGYLVTSEYYVNDAGLQMDVLTASVWLRALNSKGLEIAQPLGMYQGDYLVSIGKKVAANFVLDFSQDDWNDWLASLDSEISYGIKNKYLNEQDEITGTKLIVAKAKSSLASDYNSVLNVVLEEMLSEIKSELATLNITMDNYFSEQRLTHGKVEEVLNLLVQHGHTYEHEQALWFASTKFGDDKDRVLIRSNGERTYFANDIAYHWDKVCRGYDRLVNFLGSDHHGYVARLQAALKALGATVCLDVRLVQFVSLVKQGERIAMSTRKANFEKLTDVVADCGIDATRFFYTEKHIDQPLDFDMELAITKNHDNPVFYVQYAYARLSRLLSKDNASDWNYDFGAEESEILDMLWRLDEIMWRCIDKLDPCFLAGYTIDLAKKIHAYYNNVPVLTVDDDKKNMRLAVLEGARLVLGFCLDALGVSSPESM